MKIEAKQKDVQTHNAQGGQHEPGRACRERNENGQRNDRSGGDLHEEGIVEQPGSGEHGGKAWPSLAAPPQHPEPEPAGAHGHAIGSDHDGRMDDLRPGSCHAPSWHTSQMWESVYSDSSVYYTDTDNI